MTEITQDQIFIGPSVVDSKWGHFIRHNETCVRDHGSSDGISYAAIDQIHHLYGEPSNYTLIFSDKDIDEGSVH